MTPTRFPQTGLAPAELFEQMEAARANDVDWRRGRVALYVHYAGDDVLDVAKEAYRRFFSENGLGLKAFPSLRKFEEDIIAWTADLLAAGPQATGVVTSGGTESIFLAMKAARDWARVEHPAVREPEVIAPVSAHPAFDKAAHYLCMRVRRIPVGADFRADVAAMAAAVGPDTIMLVGSAPSFPYGVIEDIPALGALARDKGLWLHVDACVGGFLSPFVRRLGYPIPPFDFSVEGVRSMSADLHKYGFTAKGASVLLLSSESLRRYLTFEFDNWPRGKYAVATFAGSRPGGAIAAAWAVMRYLGVEGYMRLAKSIMETRDRLVREIAAIPGLYVVGAPDLSVLGVGGRGLDIFAVAEEMGRRGWFVSTMSDPPGIHLGMLTLAHVAHAGEYLGDLAASAEAVRAQNLQARSREASYGG
ncbi:MAG: aspartate aminotransferase family protein [Betaproteobacteria bacterium]|nr:aspartate aminotransferase family protein [Betaproteobacteria bacterium]